MMLSARLPAITVFVVVCMIAVAYSIVAAVPVSICLGIFAIKVLPAYIVVPNLSKKKKLPMNSIFT